MTGWLPFGNKAAEHALQKRFDALLSKCADVFTLCFCLLALSLVSAVHLNTAVAEVVGFRFGCCLRD